MAVLHKKVDPVLLESDGIGVRFGYALNDLYVLDIQLEAAGCPLVGSNLTRNDDG